MDILEFFYHNTNHNFIFAPHCILFQRKLSSKKFPKKFSRAKHMLIDFGSEQSVDMTYTQSADIYLGDVSSQIYEFIHRSRPCVFLNTHAVNWQNDKNYQSWHFGRVISQLTELKELFSRTSLDNPHAYLQEKNFTDHFPTLTESAASRACLAIHQKILSNQCDFS